MDFAVTGEAGTEVDLDRLTPISLVGPLSLASLQTLVNRRLNKDAAAHAAALKDKSLRARAARFRTSDRQAGQSAFGGRPAPPAPHPPPPPRTPPLGARRALRWSVIGQDWRVVATVKGRGRGAGKETGSRRQGRAPRPRRPGGAGGAVRPEGRERARNAARQWTAGPGGKGRDLAQLHHCPVTQPRPGNQKPPVPGQRPASVHRPERAPALAS